VEATPDAAAAIARAGEYLASDPVRLNVIWSVMKQGADGGFPGRFWLLETDRDVAGIVMETPPGYLAGVAPMGRGSVDAMAAAIFEEGHRLSGVAGEAAASSAFAGIWSDLAKTAAFPEDAQRLYVLGDLVLHQSVPGILRRARHSERELIIGYWTAFQAETGLPRSDTSPAVASGLSTGRIFVWDDDGVRCVARATEPLGGISRIGLVFTPPRWRRRGYAAACVGALSAWLRNEEAANAVLYAQLGNPTSNAVYRRLGFNAVSEHLSYRFGDVGGSEVPGAK